MNNSYAIVGSHLLAAATKRGTTPIVYHPSNLGFRHPRQFHELVSIANQWRWFDDVQDTWASVSGIIEEVCLARSSACCLVYVSATLHSPLRQRLFFFRLCLFSDTVSHKCECNKNQRPMLKVPIAISLYAGLL